jgi:hypothetical protein
MAWCLVKQVYITEARCQFHLNKAFHLNNKHNNEIRTKSSSFENISNFIDIGSVFHR